MIILIHGSPEVMALAVDGQKHLVEMPCVPGPRPSTPQQIGILLTEIETPLTDGLVGHVDAACEQQLLHVAVAQGKTIIQPDPVADDGAGKAVVLVTLGVCGWGRAWLPILGVNWSWRVIAGLLCHRSGSRVNKLTKPF